MTALIAFQFDYRAFQRGLKPDPLLTVSQWSDQSRVLSAVASAEPGRWRTSRTPYLKEIMDALSPSSPVEKVIFMKGAQIGGTEAGNNWVGYVIDQAPGAMLVVQPTVEMGKRWSKGRLSPLIEDTPCLRGKVKDPRSRDSGNTVQSKQFAGGTIVVTGANSAVGLRSMPVRYLFLDEIDAYPGDADGEGDPVNLAIQRTNTFSRRKIFLVSTPTIQGLSRIEQEFEASDKRYYWVPCPHCNAYQVLKWSQVKWEDDPLQAWYVCLHCEGKIESHHKTAMLAQGEWRSEFNDANSQNNQANQHNETNRTEINYQEKGKEKKEGKKSEAEPKNQHSKNSPNPKIVGFHLSSLYSPAGWFSWGDAAAQFVKAKSHESLLKVWVNTTLGETWIDKGDAPDWQRLFERRESYKIGQVPQGGLVLTAGVDVQQDRLEMEVVAWGRERESWSVDYHLLLGDPQQPQVWQRLNEKLRHVYDSADGAHRTISMLAIDAGFATQSVYAWVRTQPPTQVMAVKGMGKTLVPVGTPSKVDVTVRGRKLNRGARLWPLGVSILKTELYQLLGLSRTESGFPAGYCHFPEYDAAYFQQLTAEQLVTRVVKGYPKREWQKIRDRNEALDCRVYARAASIALGIDRWNDSQWEKLTGNMALVINQKRHQATSDLTNSRQLKPTQSKLAIPIRPRVIHSQFVQR
jgi:phage terminase large subunit GpA-like protein